MSNTQFPSDEEISKWPPPRLGKFIRDLGFDPDPMDAGQRREFIKAKKAETEKPKRGAKPKEQAQNAKNGASKPLTHQPMADLKNKMAMHTGVAGLEASTHFTAEQAKWLAGIERRLATVEAAIGVAAASASPPIAPQEQFPDIAQFMDKDKEGNLTFTLPIAKVDELNEKQCVQLAGMLGEDLEGNVPIRVLKMRLKQALQRVYEQDVAASKKGAAPAAASKPAAAAAKPAAAAVSYAHGDIVKAKFGGETLDPVRYIRAEGKGKAVVHWGSDDTFSVIPVSDIVGKSSKPWKLDEVDEDVAISF